MGRRRRRRRRTVMRRRKRMHPMRKMEMEIEGAEIDPETTEDEMMIPHRLVALNEY